MSSTYLNNQFYTSLIEGNSERNIQLGYLIRKGLPFTYEHRTHRNRSLDLSFPDQPGPHFMSRDISELRIIAKNKILYILLHVHLKSQRNVLAHDPNGQVTRLAEMKLLLQTQQTLQKRYPLAPVIMLGDFNHFPQIESPEIIEIEDLLPASHPGTFYHFSKGGEIVWEKLDFIYFPKWLAPRIKLENSGIFWPRNDYSNPTPPPKSPFDRLEWGSDHLAKVIDILEENFSA